MKKIIKKKDGTIVYEKGKYMQTFGILSQKYISKKILEKFTKEFCKKKGLSTSKKDILDFAKDYNIEWRNAERCKNTKTLSSCVNKFKSLNEFFIRKKNKNLIKIYKKNNNKFFVSPADSRTLIFNSEKKSKVWIKGKNYSINSILNIKKKEDKEYYKKSIIIISRLAPVDYHRFHSPIGGIFIKKEKIKGYFYSVDPIIVRSDINVYGQNERINYYIKTKYFGIVAISIIGATCVGSIILKNIKKGDKIKKGDELGYFKFGGSTLVSIIPTIDIVVDKNITKNTSEKIETYVEVGEYLLKHNY